MGSFCLQVLVASEAKWPIDGVSMPVLQDDLRGEGAILQNHRKSHPLRPLPVRRKSAEHATGPRLDQSPRVSPCMVVLPLDCLNRTAQF